MLVKEIQIVKNGKNTTKTVFFKLTKLMISYLFAPKKNPSQWIKLA